MKKPDYGDKVRIKTKEKMIEEFGGEDKFGMICAHPMGFNEEMSKLCGKMVTVKSVRNYNASGKYGTIYRLEEINYSWTLDMFELVDEVTENIYNILRGNPCLKKGRKLQ